MDLNGDQRLDIVSGCYSVRAQPMTAPVWVLYGTEEGDFAEAVALENDEGQHIVTRDTERDTITDRICTEPFATDWDGDGDLDFVIGNFAGMFLLAINQGTAKEPLFKGKPEFLKNVEGDPLRIDGHHGAPFVVDWDGDGDADLISGSGSGGVQIAENTATEKGEHRFEGFRTLIEPERSVGGPICAADTPVRPSRSTRVCVADYNGDGKLDIILGDCLRRSHPKGDLTVEEANERQAAWQKALSEMRAGVDEIAKAMEEETDDEKKAELMEKLQAKNKDVQEHYQKRSDFIEPVSTGHVWVYLRK